ncbi:UDP-4-amino-4,6-dideoxy-N-acetyl-beta-L-altrosamine N-acetyltransferase [Pararhodobacter oceanensis]|uniref:UDP-4-amino-4, 6-dideoxy-N-acetyl-beta-L-altrosamine N-acetyltransferase n=1 Tax=Pararhodobacter oceanensis TaxID=2172121 RepID=A0A2T8HPA6_9RHOB|nr:UDP-4-amino-4,6-dideoxy-N-acetyl-beta-L-altrosamine N-acetyltransferase [Pararhodobacter oceanensis]
MPSIGNLRHITETDLEFMRSWRNAPEVASKMYTRHHITAQEHRAWWSQIRTRDDQAYFIYEKSNEPLGVVGFTQIDLTNENCFWAFYASPDAPRGTGSRMEFLALDHVFTTLKLRKLSCEVLAFNDAVIKLHQKFGFQIEGVFRGHHKMDSEFMDIVRLSIMDHEWRSARENFVTILNR